MDEIKNPWEISPFDKFDIIGLNHYYIDDKKHIFVCMSLHGTNKFIKAEGLDSENIWLKLALEAGKLDEIKSYYEEKN